MALEGNAKKTEHNGAKNSSHDKAAHRAELKDASRKLRRRNDRVVAQLGDEGVDAYRRHMDDKWMTQRAGRQ